MPEPPPGEPRPIDDALVDGIVDGVDALRDYFRLEVEGLHRVPDGPAVLAANHTGTLALDAVLLHVVLRRELGRTPYTAVHPSFFRPPLLRDLAARVGLYEVSVEASTRLLDRGDLLLFFPEGEEGNFKPIWRYYQLQDFYPGFSRAALAADAPIVPVAVVGGEDANPSLGRLPWVEGRLNVPLPIHGSLVPLPARWRIEFLDPVPTDKWAGAVSVDRRLDERVAEDVRERMQTEIDRIVEDRGNPFL